MYSYIDQYVQVGIVGRTGAGNYLGPFQMSMTY